MQQQTNFFTPTQKHLIQLHGFPNITDIIYVKPLYSVRSLVVYPSLRPDSVAIPLFHSAEGQRYLSPQYYLLFATYLYILFLSFLFLFFLYTYKFSLPVAGWPRK